MILTLGGDETWPGDLVWRETFSESGESHDCGLGGPVAQWCPQSQVVAV